MEEEHNFIKTEKNYEPEIEKSSSNGVMLTIVFLILLIAGICYWIYNSNTYTKFYSYKNSNIDTNTQLSNKNDILNRNNIKKNLDYLLEIKYKEYIAPHVNSFNSIIDNSGLLNVDTRTIAIIFAGTVFTIIASMFLFRGNNSEALENADSDVRFFDKDNKNSENSNENKKDENVNKLDTSGVINALDDDKKIIDTNNDGDKLVLKNNYYKYNKNADNVYWNVIKKNMNYLLWL